MMNDEQILNSSQTNNYLQSSLTQDKNCARYITQTSDLQQNECERNGKTLQELFPSGSQSIFSQAGIRTEFQTFAKIERQQSETNNLVNSLKVENNDFKSQNNRLQLEIQRLSSELNAQKSELNLKAEHETKLEKLYQEQKIALQNNAKDLAQRFVESEQGIQELRLIKKDNEYKIKEIRNKLLTLKQESDSMMKEISNLKEENLGLKRKLVLSQDLNTQQKQKISLFEAQHANSQHDYSEALQTIKSLENQKEHVEKINQNFEQTFKTVEYQVLTQRKLREKLHQDTKFDEHFLAYLDELESKFIQLKNLRASDMQTLKEFQHELRKNSRNLNEQTQKYFEFIRKQEEFDQYVKKLENQDVELKKHVQELQTENQFLTQNLDQLLLKNEKMKEFLKSEIQEPKTREFLHKLKEKLNNPEEKQEIIGKILRRSGVDPIFFDFSDFLASFISQREIIYKLQVEPYE